MPKITKRNFAEAKSRLTNATERLVQLCSVQLCSTEPVNTHLVYETYKEMISAGTDCTAMAPNTTDLGFFLLSTLNALISAVKFAISARCKEKLTPQEKSALIYVIKYIGTTFADRLPRPDSTGPDSSTSSDAPGRILQLD